MSVIIVVLPKLEDAKKIRKILLSHGFSHVFACSYAASALQEINEHDCGLVISSCRLKDMHYKELSESLPKYFELVLMGTAKVIGETEGDVLSLTVPLKIHDLVNTVNMVIWQLEKRMKKGKSPKRRSEWQQNYIRNAKLLLMERNHLTEEEAHRYVQKCSMDNGTNMVETAQMILTLMYDEI